ncbi:glycoside hydrolase family 43 protein [Iamia sp.]|uniref:glycoside hydrolase family 43 protein n=1 Tax=Iamia sp. TaxID=2722710 RepID=UPI002B9B5A5E|nr:glycoside hydrolase family 43 protein [Iamia sp.]HXH57484.1 glycoside hydrolase family 43 protein [Iamia sp.]
MAYVFTFFRGGGGQGVHLAVSTDGLEFREVNEGEPILTSELGEGLTRDPSILLGPEGRWHMVWTSGDLQSIGLSSSDDLLSWDEPRAVAVMEHEPTAINSWAPELHWDATAERYSVVWASTVRRVHPSGTSEPAPDGEAFEHRLYVSHSTDLQDWTEGELYWDGAINAIDAAVVRDEDTEDHVLVYKDERLVPEVRKRVAVATASGFDGPWDEGAVVEELGSWVEGPSLVRDLDDEGWLLYADRYYGETYAAASSPDLETWTDRAAEVTMPPGARHGTVLRVPYERIEGLLDSAVPVPDPDTTSTTAATPIPDGPRRPVDPSTYGDERPTTGVGGVLFDLLTAQGVEPNRAVCAAEVLLTRTTEAELLAAGLVELTDEAVAPVIAAALDCGIAQDQVDATLQAARGG